MRLTEHIFRRQADNVGGFDPQTRLVLGSAAQFVIRRALKKQFGTRLKYVSIAQAGSQLADIVVKIDGKPVRIEVKNRANANSHVTLFDTSARRGERNFILDDLAGAISTNKFKSFEQLIDHYRKQNPAVGYPNDEGTPQSGKLPPELRTIDSTILDPVFINILSRFHESGDSYLALYSRSDGSVEIYYTGHGSNVLGAPELPHLTKLILDTYGAAYKGAMRVALKVKFETPGKVLPATDIGTQQTVDPTADRIAA